MLSLDFMPPTHNAWFTVLNDYYVNKLMNVKSMRNARIGWDTGHITNMIQSSKGNQYLGTIC